MLLDEVRGDARVPPAVLDTLEERYLHPIEQATKLEALAHDPTVSRRPVNHPALFSITADPRQGRRCQLPRLADRQRRSPDLAARPNAQAFLVAYGLLATYLHDVGMHDLTTSYGRRLHPIYAAQLVFGTEFDDLIEDLLGFDGPLSAAAPPGRGSRATRVPSRPPAAGNLLSLTLVAQQVDGAGIAARQPGAFRNLVQQRRADRPRDASRQRVGRSDPCGPEPLRLTANTDRYASAARRLLRVARVRRGRAAQPGRRRRSTPSGCFGLRTRCDSEGRHFERHGGTSPRSTRPPDRPSSRSGRRTIARLYLLRGHSPKSAGEANLRAVRSPPRAPPDRVPPRRLPRGRGAIVRCREHVAIVAEILADVLPCWRPGLPDDLRAAVRPSGRGAVQLERPGTTRSSPTTCRPWSRLCIPSRAAASPRRLRPRKARGRHQQSDGASDRGAPWPGLREARRTPAAARPAGARIDGLDLDAAFADLRRVFASPPASSDVDRIALGFVYMATGPGLRSSRRAVSSVDYQGPLVPVGTTGVIRRAERNAEVTAERELELLMIPGDGYVRDLVSALRLPPAGRRPRDALGADEWSLMDVSSG